MTPDGRPAAEEPVRLLQGRFGAIGQVTAAPGGALVFVTHNREAWGEGHDVLDPAHDPVGASAFGRKRDQRLT